MAESLTSAIKHTVLAATMALACTASPATENLSDPTRPAVGAGAPPAAMANTGPILQSVLIAAGSRSAIISGQTVRVGDKLGEARVIKIAENEVVLRNGKDLQTLKLFQGIEKQPASTAYAGKSK